jgi:hypothetical protein
MYMLPLNRIQYRDRIQYRGGKRRIIGVSCLAGRPRIIRVSCLLAALVSAGILQPAQAQIAPTQVITTAAPSLRIPTDARATGMGNVGIATAPDASSNYWNLAKTPFADKQSEVALNYSPWMPQVTSGMYLLGLSGYYRLDSRQAVTASVRYFSLGNFQLKDINDNVLQSANPNEMSADLGYARKLSDKWSVGVALRFIESKLVTGTYEGMTYKAGVAVAGDVSVFYNGRNREGQGFSAGLVLSNVGSRISYTDDPDQKDFLPANLGAGVAYTIAPDEENTLTFAVDINKLLVPAAPTNASDSASYYKDGVLQSLGKGFGNNAWQYGIGAEYTYHKQFSLRVGYDGESESEGNQKGFTAGLGLSFHPVTINLSYLAPGGAGGTGAQNPLSNTLRFGILFALGK